MSDTEQQATNHKQPSSKAGKAAAAAESAAETVSEAVDTAADIGAPTPDGPAPEAGDTRTTMEGISQAAGDAAQRAGVAAQRATEVLTDVAGDVASTVSAHAPAVIDASRATAGIAAREVKAASSENLTLGTVFSSGIAFGLMLARAPRIMTLLALVPGVVFGASLVGRRNGRGTSSTGKTASKTAGKSAGTTTGSGRGTSTVN